MTALAALGVTAIRIGPDVATRRAWVDGTRGAAPVLFVLVGATTGAVVAFSLARAGGRRAVEQLASGRSAQVDDWIGHRGLAVVITLRLVPLVPFSAANDAAGLTAIRGRDLAVGTAVGIVPVSSSTPPSAPASPTPRVPRSSPLLPGCSP